MNVNLLLKEMLDQDASDIHLKVGSPPLWRINGKLINSGGEKLTAEHTEAIAFSLMDEEQKEKFRKTKQVDLAKDFEEWRLRANVSRQKGTISIAMRVIPQKLPTFDDLNLPDVLKEIAVEPRGLVLVTGTAGSGKSTTIAAMINHINEATAWNIITIEDPIEFLHNDKKSCVSQRELGIDAETYAQALRNTLRQDPNLIMVGEMRDAHTMAEALNVAETGHLVMTTLHTIDAAQTVDRIIDSFSSEQQSQARGQLASTLTAVVSLRLLSRADGKGRVPAVEILRGTSTIRSLIREQKSTQLKSAIQMGASQYGMQTFDQSLLYLYKKGFITLEAALGEASSPSDLKLSIDGIVGASKIK